MGGSARQEYHVECRLCPRVLPLASSPCTLRGWMIKEAGSVGCIAESEFPQGGEADPSVRGKSGCLNGVEAKFDEFERRTSFEIRS